LFFCIGLDQLFNYIIIQEQTNLQAIKFVISNKFVIRIIAWRGACEASLHPVERSDITFKNEYLEIDIQGHF